MAVPDLVHAAAVDAWYRHLLSAELRNRGHDVVAVDLPVGDHAAGLPDGAAAVVRTVRDALAAAGVAGGADPGAAQPRDRFLPPEVIRGVTRDRLRLGPDVMSGDHCPMLGHPVELADRSGAYHQAIRSSTPGARTSR
ncbi:hypothetical protein [Kocuria sabuli]|uniref:hypothetical protein n=1 Tax=Kocuria sabuli TaxID=3071448 RepID=UPI0034D69E0E